MRCKYLAALVSAALALAACTPQMQTEMQSWIGHQDSELVSAWGAPSRETKLSDGSRVMTWARPWTGYGGSQHSCEQSFTISGSGVVTRWSYRDCAVGQGGE